MFSAGPLVITVQVTGTVPDANGKPSIPSNHNGATHVVRISNLLTVPVDVEIGGAFTNNLLVFRSGPTWSKLLKSVPAFVRSQPPPPTQLDELIIRPANAGSGSEDVRCSQVRWCNSGAPGFSSWHFPSLNNTVALVVPP